MNPEQDIFFSIPPEDNRVPDPRQMTLDLCRLTYMIIYKFVADEEQREEYLDFVDDIVLNIQCG